MDPFPSRTHTPTQFSTPTSIYHHPYFTPTEVETLSEKQRGKNSIVNDERTKQLACGFVEAVGARIGFPRRTIATAQNLYHRFHLFFPRKAMNYNHYDVSLACLYVSAKMHDTLKKPVQLLSVSYAIRFPEYAAKSKHPGGEVDLETMDPQMVEHDRRKLLAVESVVLGTICYNFTSRVPFPYVIKIGRELGATKKLSQLAWRIAADSHRTLLPLQYPPHTLALGSLFLAALLTSFEQPAAEEEDGPKSSHEIAKMLSGHGDWEGKFKSQVEDLEDIAHSIIDLIISAAQASSTSANTSPATPSSPSPHPSRHPPSASFANNLNTPCPYNPDTLIRLKISMRETEHPPRMRQPLGSSDPEAVYRGEDFESLGAAGTDKGTFRFLFGPRGVEG